MLGRLFRNLLFGLIISAIGALIMAVIGLIANLPRIIQGLLMVLRLLLRFSYQAYALILGSVQPQLLTATGVDLLEPTLRTMLCILLSAGIGGGVVTLLGWQIGLWWLGAFILHGLVVGLAWEQIVRPGEFQLGERWE